VSLWFTIPLEAGIILAVIALIRLSSATSLYTSGIIENCLALDTDRGCLQVRAYVDETLVHELPAPSKLISRMFIRETNASVPLTFVRVPPYVSPKSELSDEWQELEDVSVRPVIFSFDLLPDLAVRPGQLVDVYIGER
jgi:HlyD family secretion protein